MHRYRESSAARNQQFFNSRTTNLRGVTRNGRKRRKLLTLRTFNSKNRFTVFRSAEILQKKSSNHEIREIVKKKVRISTSYRSGKKAKIRIVDKKFSRGFAFRAFFALPYGRIGIASQYAEIKNTLPSLAGRFKAMTQHDYKEHYDSIFLDDESDLHILVLLLGRSKITKIFQFE